MKRDRSQRDHSAINVAAFRHFRLIALFSRKKMGALLKNRVFLNFFLLFKKNPNSQML